MAIPSPGSGKAADVPADRHSLQMIRLNRLRGCPASPTVRFGFKLVRRELECWWLPRLVENRLLRDVGTEGQEEVPRRGWQPVGCRVGRLSVAYRDGQGPVGPEDKTRRVARDFVSVERIGKQLETAVIEDERPEGANGWELPLREDNLV